MWARPFSTAPRQGLVSTPLESGETLGPAEAKGRTRRWLTSVTWCLAQPPGTAGGDQGPHPLSFRVWVAGGAASGQRAMHGPHAGGPRTGQLALTPEPGAFPASALKAPHPGDTGQLVTAVWGQHVTGQMPHGCFCRWLLSILSGPF